jgi:hypothetical protein
MPVISLKLSKEVYEKLEGVARERSVTVYQLVKDLVTSFARGDMQQFCANGIDMKKLSKALEYLNDAIAWLDEVWGDIENITKIVKEINGWKLPNIKIPLVLARINLSELKKATCNPSSEGTSHAQAVDMAR